MHPARATILALIALMMTGCGGGPARIRVATYNAEDIRPSDIAAELQPRLTALAEVIDRLDPDILLLQEIARDAAGINAQRFADKYLPNHRYAAFMPETNTGIPSGHDLDRSGESVDQYPIPDRAGPDGAPPPQTDDQRAYGNDCFGFGTFPGQYAMALLVAPPLEILHDQIRSYRLFRWKDLPDVQPPLAADGTPWYTPEAWDAFRLSSKTLADVPVRLPDGSVLHCVISHPTPPAFDGPEARNKLRNRDEIRLLRAYLDNEPWLVDDRGQPGGLPPGALAVVMGDLNADPIDGSSVGDPIAQLLGSPVLGPDPAPRSDVPMDGLDPTDTAAFRLRVDYVLPSRGVGIVSTGVLRPGPGRPRPSDHFPVWADLVLHGPNPQPRP